MSKKQYTTEELKAKAIKEVFPFNKDAEFLYATADGQFFRPEAKNSAKEYAKSNGFKLEIIHEGEAPEAEKVAGFTEAEFKALKVYQVKEEIKKIDSVEDLKVLLDWDNTKTGKAAIEARIDELDEAEKSKNPDTNHEA